MKIYSIAIALSAAALLGGCRRTEISTTPVTAATPAPLMVNVGVDRLLNKAGVVTGEAFTNEQKINVILVDEIPATATPEYPATSLYVCDIKGVAPTDTITWDAIDTTKRPLVVINPASVLAHYPAKLPNPSALSADKRTMDIVIPAEIPYGDITDLNFNAVKVNVAGISAEAWFAKGDDDYMTGYGGTVTAVPATPGDPSTTQNKTNIVMKHSLAMVVVRLVMDPTNPDVNKTIDGLWVNNIDTITGPLQRGSVNLADNAFTSNGKRISYNRPMAGFRISGGPYFGMLVYPATIGAAAPDVEIVSAVGAARYTYKVPAVNWEAGKVYLYTIKLMPASGVLSDGVRVVDWPASIVNEVIVD